MGGDNRFTFSITRDGTSLYQGSVSGLDRGQWGTRSVAVTVGRTSTHAVISKADMDAVFAYRAKCDIYHLYNY
ncbi:hypothetical protein BCF74_10529 [Knoellia remsis]|uniref:Uncharacterized protein n=1 Tax=Knoellia remsis TaxID=407159 RepID=A0A2T0UU85_9MICO|nr:hypothetical protein BCF74_10529 [Knoellia remsis]